MTNTLKIDKHNNGITVITFNRPDALNALNLEAMVAFWHTIREIKADDSIRVLILTGAGDKAFCSGGDLVELSQHIEENDAHYFTRIMREALAEMENLPIPVIGAINGYALGGGSEIALACDMRIVDSATKMGMVQINMALTPGWGAGQRLLRLVGYSKAMELLLKGTILSADDLLDLKLANQKVEEGMSLQIALSFAEEIASRPPKVVHGIKTLLRAGLTQSPASAQQTEQDIFPSLWADTAHIEAVATFFERQAKKRQEKK